MSRNWRSVHERKAWEWALSTESGQISAENVKQAYRVTCRPCKSGFCRVNCKWNPNCLNGLGEGLWLTNTTGNVESSELEERVRPNDGYCGLRNLGATCYVNSLLQVWYSDVRLREVVYSIEGVPNNKAMHESQNAQSIPDPSIEEPSSAKMMKLDMGECCSSAQEPFAEASTLTDSLSVVEQLQVLFLRLQMSKKRVLETTEFVDSLHLHHSRQQDAQEFRKLFLSLLNSAFQKHVGDSTCIDDLYRGSYSYVTRCEGCGGVSAVDSLFYELELGVQGCPSLAQALTQFFKQESLDGDNQYHCSQCSSRQDARRYIQLKALPPVLTLQMLRFVFDMSLLAKVKVTSYLTFPDQLDMSSYLGHPTPVYQLSALIVHCGPSAYSGHYTAHVKDHKTGKWWKFDDDTVEVHKKEKLIICSDEDDFLSVSSTERKPRCSKGNHLSNNVYMLVYKREDHIKNEDREAAVPAHLQLLIDVDNAAFMDTVQEWKTVQSAVRSAEECRAAEMRALFKGLSVKADSDHYHWVFNSWIRHWLVGELPSVDGGDTVTESLLCKHSKLSLNAIPEVKRVSSVGVNAICEKLDKFQHPARIASDMLCEQCVRHRCEELQLKHKMEEHHKIITKLLKVQCTSASGFWVGKKSLQNWRKFRLKEFEGINKGTCTVERDQVHGTNADIADESQVVFNADLLCEHGELCIGETRRRLVKPEVWTILQEHFPFAKPYPALHTVCQQCMLNKTEADKDSESRKTMCRLQKEKLSDLYYQKNRPQLTELQSEVYALPVTFLDNWSSFIRFPNTYKMPGSLCVDLLLCAHGNLSVPLTAETWETVRNHVVLVYPKEWQTLLQWYTCQESVHVCPAQAEDSHPQSITTTPGVCEECSAHWQPDDHNSEQPDSPSYIYVYCPSEDDDEEQALLKMSMIHSSKSTRKRIPAGAHKFDIDLTQSLLQLQLMVMNKYAVTPREQSLYLHGELLTNADKSLAELGIDSGSVIVLKTLSEKEKLEAFLKETAHSAAKSKDTVSSELAYN